MVSAQKKLQIAVIGPAGIEEYPEGKRPDPRVYALAEEVGKLLAQKGAIVITGGKSGIMETAARGARSVGGMTVGVVKGPGRRTSNDFIDVEVISGSAAAGLDEFLVIGMSDGAILLGGGAGTLEEIAIAYRNKKPIVAIKGTGGWAEKLADLYLDERQLQKIFVEETALGAVTKLMSVL